MAKKLGFSKLHTPCRGLLIKKKKSSGQETLFPLPKMSLRMLPLSVDGFGRQSESGSLVWKAGTKLY